MPHELFLTTRQKAKVRNGFANNMSIDIKLSKTQLAKIIQLSGNSINVISKLGEKVLTKFAAPFLKNILPHLATKATSSLVNNFESKINGQKAVRGGKGFTLFISKEVMNNIIKIIKSLEDSGMMVLLKQ